MSTGRLVVGIDLGTTHTVVAWADPEAPSPARGAAPDPAAPRIRVLDIPQLVSGAEVAARPLLSSCLYSPIQGEFIAELQGARPGPHSDATWIVGEYARRRGGEVPGRFVASSKSWLCHAGVDREAAILPWGVESGDSPHLSPVDAGARILMHVRRAWDEAFPGRELAAQNVVLTVPASFDEVARELTVEAARRAGLTVRLLEEPQAAFYDFLDHDGQRRLGDLLGDAGDEALVMVCDIGGGTTDLSLIKVTRGEAGSIRAARVAVGNHLLLGGDNMDLALAHLCEPRLGAPAAEGEPPPRLDPARFAQLVLACRTAKERLLGEEPPADVGVSVLGAGSRLVGGALATRLARDEVQEVVLEGFLPIVPRDARPQRRGSALVAFGLPYERDVAMTRHLAWFFARHAPDAVGPRALLLNGGVLRSPRIAARIADAIRAWGGPPLTVLPHADPDLAVARGAVAYGLALEGHGITIEGGAARGYYLGLEGGGRGAAAGSPARKAICVLPRGAREGTRYVAAGRTLALLVGRPARFDLFASDDDAVHSPGDVVAIDEDRFQALPPVAAAIKDPTKKSAEVHVHIEGELTAVGTLDLACVEVGVAPPAIPRRFRLAFQLRSEAPGGRETGGREAGGAPAPMARVSGGGSIPSGAPAAGLTGRFDEAAAALDRVFGKGKQSEAREVKGLSRELERLLGERSSWTLEVARGLFDALWPNARSRRRSAEHERVFWSLAGFCLRPGFGHPLDADRAAALASLFAERLAFPGEARGWQQFWIAWRRVAAGLEQGAQTSIRDATDPYLAPAEAKLKKPKGSKPEALDLLLELSSSLERVPVARRVELGGWVLERTWTDRDPRLWAAIGRLGARVPAYASVHHVISPVVAERWLDHLLREKWQEIATAAPAAVQIARVTGDRARDVSERIRRDVERRLGSMGAGEAWIRAVREVVAVEEADRAAFFGEGLPVGLRLVEQP